MNDARFGDTVGQLSRHLVVGEFAFINLILIAYVIVATLIGGAASPGAGLGILATGLFVVLALDFVHWRKREGRGSWDSDDLASLAARMIAARDEPPAPAKSADGADSAAEPDASAARRTRVSPGRPRAGRGDGTGDPADEASPRGAV